MSKKKPDKERVLRRVHEMAGNTTSRPFNRPGSAPKWPRTTVTCSVCEKDVPYSEGGVMKSGAIRINGRAYCSEKCQREAGVYRNYFTGEGIAAAPRSS